MGNKHMKKCSRSLAIRKIHINTTWCHLTLVRMAIISKYNVVSPHPGWNGYHFKSQKLAIDGKDVEKNVP